VNAEELAPIWAAYWGLTDDLDRETAHEVLVRQFLPLANYLARRALAKAPPHQDPEDIRSYAHHGLLDAIERFRPDAGASFETYATRRITGSIIDGQRKQDPLTRSGRRTVKTMAATIEDLWAEHGREPTLEEIAEASGLEEDVVRRSLVEQQTMNASLDLMAEQGGHEDSVGPSAEGDVELQAQMAEIGRMVSHRLANLGGRERAFTLLYYRDGMSMSETAEALDIGSDWCNRTRTTVLAAIRGTG
jgi:RNA polymerase sigma factor for flagellar operon FliA